MCPKIGKYRNIIGTSSRKLMNFSKMISSPHFPILHAKPRHVVVLWRRSLRSFSMLRSESSSDSTSTKVRRTTTRWLWRSWHGDRFCFWLGETTKKLETTLCTHVYIWSSCLYNYKYGKESRILLLVRCCLLIFSIVLLALVLLKWPKT